MRVLGLAGRKGHGKDTFAKLLLQHDKRYRRIAFADELKTICCLVYGIGRPRFDDPFEKERPLAYPIELDKQIERLREVAKLPEIKPRGRVAKTPRQILQFIGTDYIRAVKPTYWVDFVIDTIEQEKDKDVRFVITDARFPNEADRIRNIGGHVLRLERLAKQDDPVAEHASENLDFAPDFTLAIMENNWTLPQLIAIGSSMDQLQNRLLGFDWEKLREKAKNWSMIKGDINSHTALMYYGEYLKPALKGAEVVARV